MFAYMQWVLLLNQAKMAMPFEDWKIKLKAENLDLMHTVLHAHVLALLNKKQQDFEYTYVLRKTQEKNSG